MLAAGEEGEDVVASALIADPRDGAIVFRARLRGPVVLPRRWVSLPAHLARQVEIEHLAEE